MDQLSLMDTPDTVKVVNLVKLLHDMVANERDTKPYLLSIGEKAESRCCLPGPPALNRGCSDGSRSARE